jgi:formylmethanofuran dehydrogenase subunit E-like metal-binding protein
MRKVELNKDNRIKRYENHETMDKIRQQIAHRINTEFTSECSNLLLENTRNYDLEKQFIKDARELLLTINTDTLLKVTTQVGKNAEILHTYTGHLEKDFSYRSLGTFNFISVDRDNDNKPFTIGFSCLQSIEIIEQ